MAIPCIGSQHSRPTVSCRKKTSHGGFTLIELLTAVAVVAILASISLPAYSAFVQRARVPAALVALLSFQVRMEQRFQDVGSYANGTECGVANPDVAGFTVTCALSGNSNGFIATATGAGLMAGYQYTIDHQGTRVTVAHPHGPPAGNCWSIRGAVCEG